MDKLFRVCSSEQKEFYELMDAAHNTCPLQDGYFERLCDFIHDDSNPFPLHERHRLMAELNHLGFVQ